MEVRLSRAHSHCRDGSWDEHPILGPQQDGDPSRTAACPHILPHLSGWWGRFLRSRSPGATHPGCTSGVQLLASPSSPGRQHLVLWVPVVPTSTSQRLVQVSEDQGSHARPGGGAVWWGHFPAQTDGAGLELRLPMGWIWRGVSAQRRRVGTNIVRWDDGDPVAHHGCVTSVFPSPE